MGAWFLVQFGLRLFSDSPARKAYSGFRKGNQMHRHPALQMSLPLPYDGWSEDALRAAHKAANLRVPFERAIRNRALEICLRCLAEARLKRAQLRNQRQSGG